MSEGRMRGVVHGIGRKNGLLAILTDSRRYTIAESVGGAVNVGDEVEGPLDCLGSQQLTNVTRKRELAVFVKDACCDVAITRRLLALD